MKQLTLFNIDTVRDLSQGGGVLLDLLDGFSRWVLVIPDYWPAAANQMGENAYHRVQAEKRKAYKLVAALGHPCPRFAGKVRMRLIRLWAKKCRAKDYGNLVASTKFLEDALKRPGARQKQRRLGVIVDDSPKWLDIDWEQGASVDGRGYCVIVIDGRLLVDATGHDAGIFAGGGVA